MNHQDVLNRHFVAALAERACGDDRIIVDRASTVIVRQRDEAGRELQRLILLPPRGHTSNTPTQTNSYAEVERATIAIKGAVREGKQSFSQLKDCLLVVSFNDAAQVSDLDRPYLTFDLDRLAPGFTRAAHSAGEAPFHVVKPDGTGVYHTLLNQSDDWLVLHLHKVLRPMRTPNIESYTRALPRPVADALIAFYNGLVAYGDRLFTVDPALVAAVDALPMQQSIPVLLDMLHVRDTGNHEACTAFGMVLKIGRRNPPVVIELIAEALVTGSVPDYYAQQLTAKLRRIASTSPNNDPS